MVHVKSSQRMPIRKEAEEEGKKKKETQKSSGNEDKKWRRNSFHEQPGRVIFISILRQMLPL